MKDDLAYSRPLATAATLGSHAADLHRFEDKRILLTGEEDVLATYNGRECFLNCLRLAVRICKDVSVWLPKTSKSLLVEVRAEANRIAFRVPVRFLEVAPDYIGFDAILCVGFTARPELPWTVINSDGWLARVSSGQISLPGDTGRANPIGALAAACLGMTEVFKRLLRLSEDRGPFFNGLTFSLLTYQVGTTDPGHSLPERIPLDLLLVGIGAIGNGVVHLLDKLPITGRAWIIDRQTFQPENFGTCLLVGPGNIGESKARFAEGILSGRLQVQASKEELSSFRERLGKEVPYPALVLNGLDNIDARHEVQDIWPDLVIDGAIGAFGCQVSRHPWGEDTACLKCLYPKRTGGTLAEIVASRATGLSPERARQMLDSVTGEDVAAAPEEKRAWLKDRVGKQICSVIPEALAQNLSTEEQKDGFEPSVPFVACLSACMVVTELIRHIAGWDGPLAPRYQFDALMGPAFGLHFPQARKKDCDCVSRQRNIEKVRRRRTPA